MKKKKECVKCGKQTRISKLVVYKPTGEKRCWHCIRKYGQNRFYEPKIKGVKKKKKFVRMTLDMEERQKLYNKYIKQGMSAEDANMKVNKRQGYFRWFQRKRMYEPREEGKTKPSMKQFLKGLGQK